MYANEMKHRRAIDDVTREARQAGIEVSEDAIKARYVSLGGLYIEEETTVRATPVATKKKK